MVFDDQESDRLEQQIATFIAAHAASLRASRNKGHLDRKALHVTE
jgi:hypothetical protein